MKATEYNSSLIAAKTKLDAIKQELVASIHKLSGPSHESGIREQGGCCTVNSKNLVKDCWCAETYNFAEQYHRIAEAAAKQEPDHIIPFLTEVLESGIVRIGYGIGAWKLTLHPEVIENLCNMLELPIPMANLAALRAHCDKKVKQGKNPEGFYKIGGFVGYCENLNIGNGTDNLNGWHWQGPAGWTAVV